ncbi:hypothetical protein SMD22_00385 (plasmid) [Brevibacillus halotolerans]|nr:hypothetical protein SMD22_00385 [Brevibacillus halotolerans]
MNKKHSNSQNDSTIAINMNYPVKLLNAIKEFQDKNDIRTRTDAIINLLEVGLNAVNGIDYIEKPEIRELPCTTLRELQNLICMRRIDSRMKGTDLVFFSKNETKELDELILSVSTILQNLNFYKDHLKIEGYTALYDMGQLAYEKL